MKFATVGAGWIVDAFIAATKVVDPPLEHAAVYSFNQAEADAFAARHGVSQIYTDLDALGSSDVDAVYVANPNALHYPTAKKLLEHGKNVLCEKTSVVTSAQLQQLYDIADRNGVVFLEAIKSLYSPQAVQLTQALEKLGTVHYAKFDFCRFSSKYPAFMAGERPNIFNPAFAAGGLMDMGIYCVYPAVYFFGLPTRVNADAVFLSTGADVSGSALLGYGDLQVEISWSKGATSGHDSVIMGDRGTLHIDTMEYFGDSWIDFTDGTREQVISWDPAIHSMQYEAALLASLVGDREEFNPTYQAMRTCTRATISLMERIR
ncbi:MAG: Gfo/Idh/MocA family oxidoreductase, partial [Propionicimonas sp.]|nr:Gfo/Idh/MocA family oxidoreductase [Propionicimonas sp.]